MRGACLLLLCFLQACASQTIQAPVGDHSQRPIRSPTYHDVRQGDTLYSIAFQYGYRVEDLAGWNRLRDPYTIYKGQRLRVKPPSAATGRPKAGKIKASQPKPSQPRRSPPKPSQPKMQPLASSRSASGHRATRSVSRKPVIQKALPGGDQKLVWAWPATGKLVRKFDAHNPGKKGINIAGHSGVSIRAAAAGKVVYSGSGLAGYGRLIIIKHNKDFLSAYAHNRTLIAREGQWVERGEIIARMGRSGTDRTQLHFEIRKRGQPVDPLHYLPGR